MCTVTLVPSCTCESQRTTHKSQHSPFITGVLVIQFRWQFSLGSKFLYLLNHLASPAFFFLIFFLNLTSKFRSFTLSYTYTSYCGPLPCLPFPLFTSLWLCLVLQHLIRAGCMILALKLTIRARWAHQWVYNYILCFSVPQNLLVDSGSAVPTMVGPYESLSSP